MRDLNYNKVQLATLPTPIVEMKSIRKEIGGPRLFVKRDDLTGLGLGGNKLRKLEYLLGDAIQQGADTIVTSGAIQTNHGRLTAAACAKLGLKCILVLTEKDTHNYEANRILQKLYGAHQVFAEYDETVPKSKLDKEKLRAGDLAISKVIEEEIEKGRKPYLIPRGGRSFWGTFSYVQAIKEIKSQLNEEGIKIDHIIVPSATCSTLTGVLLGCFIHDLKVNVIGIALSRSKEEGQAMVEEEYNRDAEKMGVSHRIIASDVQILDEYIGEGYGIMTEGCKEAIKLFAKHEALLLDPVYTSKAMHGFLDLSSKHCFKNEESVLFLHTGGIPLLFLNDVTKWLNVEVSS